MTVDARVLTQVRQAVSVLRDRNHELTVQLDQDARVLDDLVALLDALDDVRLARPVRGQLHLIGGDAS